MTDHTVRQGECVSRIAAEAGFPWKKIWNDPANDELRRLRASPNVLLPGDVLVIADREAREEDCPTEQRHRFRLHLGATMLRLRFLDMGQPRANIPFELRIGLRVITGRTDGEGRLAVPIPIDADEAALRLGEGAAAEDYTLRLGELDPSPSLSGVQARLRHLGYTCPLSARLDNATRRALREYQQSHHLAVTGEPDEATRSALERDHQS